MSQLRNIFPILCLFMALSFAQAWNFAFQADAISSGADEFPWVVTVVERCNRIRVGGSLITSHAVLTTWESLRGQNASQLEVEIGEMEFMPELVIPEKVGVKYIVHHPDFNRTSGGYNLALLFLRKPIEFTSRIRPVNLATPTSMRSLDLNRCVVKGGTGMQTLLLPVVEIATCQQELRRWLGASFRLDDSLMCAGGGIWKNACEEDGYPLVCPLARDPAQFQQVGIVNWHINCGADGTPEVYINVAKLGEWINQQIRLNPYVEEPADQENAEEPECERDEFGFSLGFQPTTSYV